MLRRIGYVRCVVAICLAALHVAFVPPLNLRWKNYTLTTFIKIGELEAEFRQQMISDASTGARSILDLVVTSRDFGWGVKEQAMIAVKVRDGAGRETVLSSVRATDHLASTRSYTYELSIDHELAPGTYSAVAVLYADPPFGEGLRGRAMTRPRPVRFTGIWGSPWMETIESAETTLLIEP